MVILRDHRDENRVLSGIRWNPATSCFLSQKVLNRIEVAKLQRDFCRVLLLLSSLEKGVARPSTPEWRQTPIFL